MSAKIMVVDDDHNIREVIRFALEDAGMIVSEASNGQAALAALSTAQPELMVLDVGMPEMDGFETCKAIRRSSSLPILFLTARDEEIDRVLGFELGADDFVPKPFSPRELVLRIKAILARSKGAGDPTDLSHNDLTMDKPKHEAHLAGDPLVLTGIEYGVLHALLQAPDRVLSRNQLIEAVYGANTYLSDRTVDSHIRNVRQKAAALGYPDVIATVHGVGVKLGTCQKG
ncbi:response regulator transcription factor [Actibacterium sp. 188UL27-1]|uniref:response regulator transcription factor n=1 Tax=Actibacterium sp. 188UL27-1 TaxID=2786961 RepID=UPI001958E3BD|nr:response regulator transcription factor [Actibacterium sp. 188UL27-1]MBM7069218.1 response regulator transcription factor [Actibacterium sp. 188UL27-1]